MTGNGDRPAQCTAETIGSSLRRPGPPSAMTGVGRRPLPAPPHGTRARYQSRSHACRCGSCRAANAHYQAAYRSAPPPIPAPLASMSRLSRR